MRGLPKIPGWIAVPVDADSDETGVHAAIRAELPRQERGTGRSALLNHASGRIPHGSCLISAAGELDHVFAAGGCGKQAGLDSGQLLQPADILRRFRRQ